MSVRSRIVGAALACGLVLVPAGSALADSGISGRIEVKQPPCRDVATGAAACAAERDFGRGTFFRVMSAKGRRVERFRIQRDGRFRVQVRPGRYRIGPRCGGDLIRVKPNRTEHVRLSCGRRR